MKKLSLFAALLITGFSFAQKSTTVDAAMAYKDYQAAMMDGDFEQAAKDLNEAKGYIDQAAVHAETQNDPKTLMYQGFIYIDIPILAGASGDPALKAVDQEMALTKGFESLKKSRELDKKGLYADQIEEYCNVRRGMLSNSGITAYEEGKYEEAMTGLLFGALFGDAIGEKDSAFYFYGGIAAFKIDKFEEAKEAFSKTVEWGYQPASSSYYLSQTYLKLGDTLGAENMLKAQIAKYPGNKDIMIELINLYIDTDRKPEAVKILNDAIALDPKNAVLVYTAGTIYENMGNFSDAEINYKKAIEMGNQDAGFAIGGLYYNKGADIVLEAEKLKYGTPEYDSNYEKMMEESKVYFNQALPYLEAAAVATPKDLVVLEALKAAYYKVGNTEKFMETKKKIEEIKAAQ
jgi:tetratricopeptide (TPR) repeat protein